MLRIGKSHPHTILDHQKNREKVCLFCGRKCHMKINTQSHIISKFQNCFSDYNIADDRYPTGLCPRLVYLMIFN